MAEFDYLSLRVRIDYQTYDPTYASVWAKSVHELKVFWKSLFRPTLLDHRTTNTVQYHVYTYVTVFRQGRIHVIKQEGVDLRTKVPLTFSEDETLSELSAQLTDFGSRGWELVEVCRENEIDPPLALYLSGRRRDIFKVHCTLKWLKGKAA